YHAYSWCPRSAWERPLLLVPTLRVGMPSWTLSPRSHAPRGNALLDALRPVSGGAAARAPTGRGASKPCVPTRSVGTRSEHRVAVDVLVVEVARRALAQGDEPLRAVRRHPDHVALAHRVPGVGQAVHPLPLQHQQAVLHDVDLDQRQRGAGAEG